MARTMVGCLVKEVVVHVLGADVSKGSLSMLSCLTMTDGLPALPKDFCERSRAFGEPMKSESMSEKKRIDVYSD